MQAVFPDLLPVGLGVLLFGICLALLLSPYLPGMDFGILRVPVFSSKVARRLKVIGPIIFILIIAGFIPVIPLPCEKPVFEIVEDRKLCGVREVSYISVPQKPKTCRRRSFGVQGWEYREEITGSTGWVRGGGNRLDICTTVASGFIRDRGINPNHKINVVRRGEKGRWTGLRVREYNYHCTVKVSWNPIYREKTDNLCGMTSPVISKKIITKSCKKKIGIQPC